MGASQVKLISPTISKTVCVTPADNVMTRVHRLNSTTIRRGQAARR